MSELCLNDTGAGTEHGNTHTTQRNTDKHSLHRKYNQKNAYMAFFGDFTHLHVLWHSSLCHTQPPMLTQLILHDTDTHTVHTGYTQALHSLHRVHRNNSFNPQKCHIGVFGHSDTVFLHPFTHKHSYTGLHSLHSRRTEKSEGRSASKCLFTITWFQMATRAQLFSNRCHKELEGCWGTLTL